MAINVRRNVPDFQGDPVGPGNRDQTVAQN